MRRAVVILMLWMFAAGVVYGQEGERENELMAQLNFVWAHPETPLMDEIAARPIGANVLIGGRAPNLPLFLGTELAYLNYGIQERLDLHAFDDVPVEAAVTGMSQNIFMGHLVARLQPPSGIVRPFVDGLVGTKFFVGRSSVHSDVVVFHEALLASARQTDWALSYGVGAGVDVKVYHGEFGIHDRPGNVSLTVGARYLFGPETDVITTGFFDEERGVFDFEAQRLSSDFLVAQVGLRFDL